MKGRDLSQIVIDKFIAHKARIFASSGEWERHLQALALSEMKVTPDPVLIASEGALWGAIHHQGLLQDTVIVSDDAGQSKGSAAVFPISVGDDTGMPPSGEKDSLSQSMAPGCRAPRAAKGGRRASAFSHGRSR